MMVMMSDDHNTSKMQRQLVRALGRRRLREIRAHVECDLREIGLDDIDDFFELMRNRPEPTWRRPTPLAQVIRWTRRPRYRRRTRQ